MFIAAHFIIANFWEKSRCSSTDENIKKMWYMYIIDYSPIKKNKLEKF